jgi:hypothetical protein
MVTLTALTVCFLGGCAAEKAGNELSSRQENALVGNWRRQRDGKTGMILNILNDTSYNLIFVDSRMKFPGTYQRVGEEIQFVDRYCGTSLPGVYRFSVKGMSLSLEVLDDEKCTRRKMFPGTWIKQLQGATL